VAGDAEAAAVLLVGKLQLVSIDAVGVIGSDAGVNRGLMHALAEHVVDSEAD
jgi:hypothetical protein